jgi:DNA polymerase III subunit delta'
MNIKPILQTKLYGLNQIFNEIINLSNSNKLPNKILLYGPKGSGKSTLAYHFINYKFSINENHPYNINLNEISDQNNSFKLINNGLHPNFHLIDLIDDKKNIEISQIRNMINYANKSSFNNHPRFILIDNVENLNINASNSLLKIIEEPNENIFFILIHNDNKKILKTLKSRCLPFKINLSFDQSVIISNHLLNGNIFDLVNYDLINYYAKPGDYISLVNFSNENQINLNDFNLKNFLLLLIDGNYYKKNNFVKFNIFNYIELYFLKILNQSTNKSKISFFYTKFINKINYAKKFNLDYESLFMEFKSKVLNG